MFVFRVLRFSFVFIVFFVFLCYILSIRTRYIGMHVVLACNKSEATGMGRQGRCSRYSYWSALSRFLISKEKYDSLGDKKKKKQVGM